MRKISKTAQALKFVKAKPVLRPKDLASHGIPPVYLQRLRKSGQLIQIGRGLYRHSKHRPTAQHTLATAAKRIPQGVICLLSSLQFHGLTTQSPAVVWMAIDWKARRPVTADLPIRILRFSGASMRQGFSVHLIEGVQARITLPAKTVADCFKYRNKVGLDVAIEALRDCLRQRKCSIDEIWKYARICRVGNVIRPYLESVS